MLEKLAQAKKELTKEVAKQELAISVSKSKLEDINLKIEHIDSELELTKQANQVLSNLVSVRINTVKGSIESIINEGLALIFDEPITVEIQESVKRGKTEFAMVIKKQDFEGGSESFGGGVLSVIAFLLKVVTNLISKKARIQVYDESLTFVSVQYQERLGMFIRKLCDDLDYTIVLISHQPVLSSMAHMQYNTTKENNVTEYKLIKVS